MTIVSSPHGGGYQEYPSRWEASSPPHCFIFQFKRVGGVANPPYSPNFWAFLIKLKNMASLHSCLCQ